MDSSLILALHTVSFSFKTLISPAHLHFPVENSTIAASISSYPISLQTDTTVSIIRYSADIILVIKAPLKLNSIGKYIELTFVNSQTNHHNQ